MSISKLVSFLLEEDIKFVSSRNTWNGGVFFDDFLFDILLRVNMSLLPEIWASSGLPPVKKEV